MRSLIAMAMMLTALLGVARAEAPATSATSRAVEARIAPRLEAEMRAAGFRLGAPVLVRLTKTPATLTLYVERDGAFAAFKTYPICAFSGALGPKLRVGDGQAPEGFYSVAAGAMNPASAYHLSFNLGYPNAYDRALGRTGSALMVHGNCVSIGCYAMTDARIEEIWTAMAAAFRNGQNAVQVQAFPFPLTEANLRAHADDLNAPFWRNLAEGAALFERTGRAPRVAVARGRYVFTDR